MSCVLFVCLFVCLRECLSVCLFFVWGFLFHYQLLSNTHEGKMQYVPTLSFLAKPSIEAVGSDPMDRKHIIGVLTSLSSHMFSRFRITPSANCWSEEMQQ